MQADDEEEVLDGRSGGGDGELMRLLFCCNLLRLLFCCNLPTRPRFSLFLLESQMQADDEEEILDGRSGGGEGNVEVCRCRHSRAVEAIAKERIRGGQGPHEGGNSGL